MVEGLGFRIDNIVIWGAFYRVHEGCNRVLWGLAGWV